MNFSSHKNHLADSIEIALTTYKQNLIARFKIILGQCNSLFQTEDFTFWLRQYIDNLGKTKNGIVSVNAYAVVEGITYPLLFKIFKPKKCLKAEDTYKTKPQLASVECLFSVAC